MNIEELKKRLIEHNIPIESYSLNGERKIESLVLEFKENKYHVYPIGERGVLGRLRTFWFEWDACEYFFETILRAEEIKERVHNAQNDLCGDDYEPIVMRNNRIFVVSERGEINTNKSIGND